MLTSEFRFRIRRGWSRLWRAALARPPEPPVPTDPGLQSLIKALEAGNYDARPSVLSQGCELKVEDLSAVMKCVTFDCPHRDPRWWEVWKWASKDYMRLLRFQQERTRLKLRPNFPGLKNPCGEVILEPSLGPSTLMPIR